MIGKGVTSDSMGEAMGGGSGGGLSAMAGGIHVDVVIEGSGCKVKGGRYAGG